MDALIESGMELRREDIELGRKLERERIIKRIEDHICFDALADDDGRCIHHGGKCYELRQLISKLEKGEQK